MQVRKTLRKSSYSIACIIFYLWFFVCFVIFLTVFLFPNINYVEYYVDGAEHGYPTVKFIFILVTSLRFEPL